jgi:hypothetical protein
MKTLLIVISFLFYYPVLISQEFQKLDFEIKNPHYLVDAIFKIENNNLKKNIRFLKTYKDLSTKSTEYLKKRVEFQMVSDFEVYKDIEFKVLKVIDSDGNESTEFKSGKSFYLEILDLTNSKTVYFSFDYFHVYTHFLFKDFNLPESYYCDLISMNIDKYNQDTTYSMSLPEYGYTIYKTIKDSERIITLHLTTFAGGSPDISASTATILFTDGSVKIFSGKVNVTATAKNYQYTFSIILNDEYYNLFLDKEIETYKLASYERAPYPLRSDALKYFLNCFSEL